MARAGEHVRLRAHHEGALLHAGLAQNELQRLQRVLKHVRGAYVHLRWGGAGLKDVNIRVLGSSAISGTVRVSDQVKLNDLCKKGLAIERSTELLWLW